MKKILAMLLAVMMLLSVASVAMAEDATHTAGEADFLKKLTLNGDGAVAPSVTFSFSAAFDHATDCVAGTTGPALTIGTATFAANDTATKKVAITHEGAFPVVGVYYYNVTETVLGVLGIAGETGLILKVTVTNGDNGALVENYALYKGENKGDTVENTYSAGKLSVTKTVEGALADKNKEFNVTVTFTAPEGKSVKSPITYVEDGETKTIDLGTDGSWTGSKTVTIALKHNETITFSNIPAGMTYNVEEEDYTSADKGGYTAADYTFGNDNKTISTATDTVAIKNAKEGNIDMGVMLDSMPYVLVLAVVGAAVIALIAKKRRAED